MDANYLINLLMVMVSFNPRARDGREYLHHLIYTVFCFNPRARDGREKYFN